MERMRIIHSRIGVSEALIICLHKINIDQVEINSSNLPLELDDENYLNLVESALLKNF
jgi:hypothetical protein